MRRFAIGLLGACATATVFIGVNDALLAAGTDVVLCVSRNGSVRVPVGLRPYLGGLEVLEPVR